MHGCVNGCCIPLQMTLIVCQSTVYMAYLGSISVRFHYLISVCYTLWPFYIIYTKADWQIYFCQYKMPENSEKSDTRITL